MNLPALRVLVAGATGLVGRHCLAVLRGDARIAHVVSMQRRDEPGDARIREFHAWRPNTGRACLTVTPPRLIAAARARGIFRRGANRFHLRAPGV